LRIALGMRASTLVVRSFLLKRHVLVASPAYVERHGMPHTPDDLRTATSLGGLLGLGRGSRHAWHLTAANGAVSVIPHAPRLLTEDIIVVKQAALAGCGIAELPPVSCRDELADGSLIELLPEWSLPEVNLYAVFPSRKGLTPAVRCFIDYLSLHLRDALDTAIAGTMRFSMVPKDAASTPRLRRVS